MTVKQLIEKLSILDPEAEVVTKIKEHAYYPVNSVWKDNAAFDIEENYWYEYHDGEGLGDDEELRKVVVIE